MQGQYRVIAERPTYFPPFVNERFGRRPYWSCTFSSLLNGANVAWRGEKPATPDEVRALARASGDVDLRGGSRSSHMITAMRVRYGKDMRIRHLPPERVATRLAHGWAMVAGVTYGALPRAYRVDRSFTKGHRVLLVGWDAGRTKLIDPLADRDSSWSGRWIQWSEFEPAWWSGEQLWFREGMFLPQPSCTEPLLMPEPRDWTVREGAVLDLLSPRRAGVVVRRVRAAGSDRAQFDARIGLLPAPPSKAAATPLIRISSGPFRGYLLNPANDGVRADLSDLPGIAATSAPAPAPDPIAQARRVEWDRIHDFVGPNVKLPPRP